MLGNFFIRSVAVLLSKKSPTTITYRYLFPFFLAPFPSHDVDIKFDDMCHRILKSTFLDKSCMLEKNILDNPHNHVDILLGVTQQLDYMLCAKIFAL